jgi:uncharacterized protein (TIGR02001 family)
VQIGVKTLLWIESKVGMSTVLPDPPPPDPPPPPPDPPPPDPAPPDPPAAAPPLPPPDPQAATNSVASAAASTRTTRWTLIGFIANAASGSRMRCCCVLRNAAKVHRIAWHPRRTRTNVRRALALLPIAAFTSCASETHAQLPAPKLSAYVTAANGYWRRGLAQNDDLTMQLGLNYGHQSGWFAGAHAINVDYEAELGHTHPRETELGAYTGYHARRGQWSWTAAAARYLYPRADRGYDYTEVSVGAGFRDRVFYNAAYSRGLVSGDTTLDHEVSLAWPAPGGVEVGAAVGRFDFERVPADYSHWNVGASKIWRALVLDLRYHDNDYGRATSLGDDTTNGYVLSVTYALHRRR